MTAKSFFSSSKGRFDSDVFSVNREKIAKVSENGSLKNLGSF